MKKIIPVDETKKETTTHLGHSLDVSSELPLGEQEVNEKIEHPVGRTTNSSDKLLVFSILFILALSAGIFWAISLAKKQPLTIEQLHIENLNHKLNPEQGYVYNEVYSFVLLDNFWHMQLKSTTGKTIYDLVMRYSPRDLESIPITGWLNDTLFNEEKKYYITFNPTGDDFSHTTLSAGDIDQHMINSFRKNATAACDRNETGACKTRPIVTCNSTNSLVFYLKESNLTRVLYENNCITLEGKGFDLVKATNRMLYNLYRVMEE